MHPILDRIRTRLAPAVLTAAGIALTAAGLITYTTPTGADAQGSDAASVATPTPAAPTLGLLTFPPIPSGSASPSAGPTPVPKNRVATRIVLPALDIDLPIVKPPAGEPYCNVAMYLSLFSQPGLPGATYLFAHARKGMFLPLLLHESNGSMIGMTVWVYTSDDQVFLYKITKVRPHYPANASLADLPVKNGQLWLQTSEGPHDSSTKLQVVATFSSTHAVSHADANPKPHPLAFASC
ncbi:MAG TPA: sortase [Candidatus Limnocylindrales bacterium]